MSLKELVNAPMRRHGVLEQKAQLVRYITGINGRTTEEAWREVEQMRVPDRRQTYRLLKLAIDLGQIVWRGGQFVVKARGER